MRLIVLAALLAGPAGATPPLPPAAVERIVATDPPADPAHPAALAAFVILSGDGALNAVMYTAAGAGPHPTLLLLHGFPGNEQNLDLAQAARRAGWNVLTFHYRGSWGSPGRFTFANSVADATAALAFLRSAAAARFGVDPTRIAVAGHSMGGAIAAHAAAADRRVVGAFLIDPADFAAIARSFADPAARDDFLTGEVRGDLPPLAGTSEAAIMAEIAAGGPDLDLVAQMPALAGRPLALIGAARGIGGMAEAAAAAARAAHPVHLDAATLATDHSFSDMRIALATRLVTWLAQFQP